MYIKDFSNGLSGAKVELHSSKNNRLYVRKRSINDGQSNLLKVQHNLMSKWSSANILMPKIINSSRKTTGLFFFDMEYIRGDSLCHYLANPNILSSQLQCLYMDRLLHHMRVNLLHSDELSFQSTVYINLINKLESIKKVFMKKITFYPKIEYLLTFSYNKAIYHKLAIDTLVHADIPGIHGDLSLSNIIIANEDLFFIDPIIHYLECSIFSDYFKFLFDLDFKLSFRIENQFNRLDGSTILLISRFIEKLRSMYCNMYCNLIDVENLFLMVEAFRVLQYCNLNSYLGIALISYIEKKASIEIGY